MTLQNAPRDIWTDLKDFEVKRKIKGRSKAHRRHTKRLVAEEIEMLKVVLNLIAMNRRRKKRSPSRFEGTVR